MKQRITTLFASGVLALALFGVARAGPFEDAQAADQKGDYATELQILRPLADQGNDRAQFGLGLMYANGHGVPQDYVRAHMWFNIAAAAAGASDVAVREAAKWRDLVATRMTPAQIAEGRRLAREWQPTK
jgi:uncharacterized protein